MKTVIENFGTKQAIIIVTSYKNVTKKVVVNSGKSVVIWFKNGSIIYFNR